MLASCVENPPSAIVGERVADRVEPVHARELERDDAGHRDQEVDEPQRLRRLRDARRELLVLDRTRRLGLVELHAADAEQRQDGDHQHDDAHAAEPAERVTPEVDRRRQIIEPHQHRRAGRGQARHGLEERVGEAQAGDGHQQRHGGDRGHQRPAAGSPAGIRPGSAVRACWCRVKNQSSPPAPRQISAAATKSTSMPVRVDDRRRHRQQVCDAEQHQHRAQDVDDCQHRSGLEQPLDLLDVAPVGEEQDHVVVGLDHRVVVRHDHCRRHARS